MAGQGKGLFRDRAELMRRLILAEVLARRGEGPLAPRFPALQLRRPVRAQVTKTTAKEDEHE